VTSKTAVTAHVPFLAAILALSCRTAARDAARATTEAGARDAHARVEGAAADATADAAPKTRAIGPFEVPLVASDPRRKVYYVAPRSMEGPARLLANLHGVCNPPGYACGYWVQSASNVGFLVCPEGNSRCGGASGPPTWTEPLAKIDEDLEKAIAVVSERHPGEISREGAILTGFSLGAYSAVRIAERHPGRWPYLILNEANVSLDASALRAAGVRAVALVAGERGSQIEGEKRTAAKLVAQGFPARFWPMKDAGHHYSADIDTIMAEAIAFVLSEGAGAAGAAR
jgi:predicted esterase